MSRLLRRSRSEEGSALLIALGFISIFGLFIGAVLSETTVNLRTNHVAGDRIDKLMAADGGVEWGIQKARTQAGPAACADVPAGEQQLTNALQLDGRTVTVKCRALAGASAAPASQRWAVITTSAAADSLVTVNVSGTGDPVAIAGGDVWIGGGTNLGARNIALSQADAVQSAADCAGAAQPAALSVAVPDLWSCNSGPTPDVPHTLPAVPAVAPTTGNPTACGQPWQIFHPGKYTNLPGQHPELTQYNYFESGVYYFEDVGVLDFTNRVAIGGQPPAGESATVSPGCAPNDTTADLQGPGLAKATGKGVVFILGGRSSIAVGEYGGGSKFELFSRQPADGEATTPGLSLVAVPAGTAGGYKAWQAPSTPAYALATVSTVAAGVDVAVHGLVYAPGAPVILTTRATAPLSGGLVASKLTLYAGATGHTAGVSAQGRRTLLLTSSAASASGEIATVESAVVKIANDPANTATVRSWRVH